MKTESTNGLQISYDVREKGSTILLHGFGNDRTRANIDLAFVYARIGAVAEVDRARLQGMEAWPEVQPRHGSLRRVDRVGHRFSEPDVGGGAIGSWRRCTRSCFLMPSW